MILKKIGSIASNLINKPNKNKEETIKQPVLDKKPQDICSKNEADAIKATFIGGQNSVINTTSDSIVEDSEYYITDDDDDLSPEDKEFIHDLQTVGYVKSLLCELYFNGCKEKELTIDEIAHKHAQEIIEIDNKEEFENVICNIKEGAERINEAASLMCQDISEDMIQDGRILCEKIIYLLENKSCK